MRTGIETAATPERVWALLTDLPGLSQGNPLIHKAGSVGQAPGLEIPMNNSLTSSHTEIKLIDS